MQPIISTQQLETSKIQTQGDIRLLEKQKNDLLTSLERLQKIKSKEYQTYSQEITRLKTEAKNLEEELGKKRKELEETLAALDSAKSNIRFFTEGQIAQVNREVNEKLENLDDRTKDLEGKELLISETMAALEAAEEEMLKHGAGLAIKEEELKQLAKDLHTLEVLLEARAKQSTENLVKAHAELEELTNRAAELREEARVLTLNNGTLKEENQKMVSDMKNTVDEINRREKGVIAREEFNTDWENRLKVEDARLKDEFARKEKYA
jgi:chromosome segregation ATPase